MQYRFLLVVLLMLSGCSAGRDRVSDAGIDNGMAYRWAGISLEATARDTDRFKPRPTVTSRCLALTWTAIYDAWTRFDDRAEAVYLTGVDRVPASARTSGNKATAISYAAYHALKHYYFADSTWLAEQLHDLGFDPGYAFKASDDPASIGIAAARAVIAARVHDGANEAGDIVGSTGDRYADYTGYRPVNPADTLYDPEHWQPKYFVHDDGTRTAPGCLTAHWQLVEPLALDSASIFRSPPPPSIGSPELEREVAEVVALQAVLTPEQRALVEFMRDGPSSVQQAGHWLRFAMDVSRRDHHTLDQDANMFFLTTAAAMDAFIACWDTKMHYDFARPYALVHEQFRDRTITGWGGPDKGMTTMKGQDWRPYSPEAFLCPPFPAYVSGHSTVSAACSEVLRLFTGSDTFGLSVQWAPGSLTEPAMVGDSVTLTFPTFTATAEAAGLSRVLGGYHIQADNKEGLILGRKVGHAVWAWYRDHREGSPDH